MPQLFTNNARALLIAGLGAGDTTLTVAADKADLFPTANTGTNSVPASTDWFKLTLQDATGVEIVYVRSRTAGSGVMSNVLRGQEGTTARAFSAGSVVGLRVTAADAQKAAKGGIEAYTYDNRGNLRSVAGAQGDQAVVEGLGLFVYYPGSTEPDDDESCFATASGRWLLEAVHWDVVDAWQLPDAEARDAFDEDEPLRFASRVRHGTATCAITSVATASSTSFTGTVTGASVGDRVVATPPAQLGSTAADTGRLSCHAWVSAPNTVTVMLTNASAASATTNTAIQTAWPVTVFTNV